MPTLNALSQGPVTPSHGSQQQAPNPAHGAPANAMGFKDAKFEECIVNVLSMSCSLRRKSEALNRIIELCQKSGGLDLVLLYKFASLSEVIKTCVPCNSTLRLFLFHCAFLPSLGLSYEY